MDIGDIYEAARGRGLTRSMRHFSTTLLGRAPNYLADRASRGCSPAALLSLYRQLGELGEAELQAMAFERLLEAEARDGETRGTARP